NCCRLTLVLASTVPSSFCNDAVSALESPPTCPNLVSRRMVWMTSSSCRGTTPPVQVPPPVVAGPLPDPEPPTLGTLPTGAPPGAPLLAPSAAAISCSNFCGSLSHCLNSGPRDCAAIWAAILTSPVDGSAATNLTSLIRI